jgi:hypothetical protein
VGVESRYIGFSIKQRQVGIGFAGFTCGKRMAARDFIEISLFLVIAILCYRRGFRRGVLQTRKIWRGILEKSAQVQSLGKPETPPATKQPQVVMRGSQAVFLESSSIQGRFGRN